MKNLLAVVLVVFFSVSIQAQEVFRTQTPGGWGSSPKGDNPGAYLEANLFNVFSGPVTIGYGENTIQFYSAEDISKFLPSSGTPSALDGAYINPTKQEVRNTLVSHTLALTISLAFDRAIADFSASSLSLANQVIAMGDFEGMTVQAVLDEANKYLGGVESAYSASQLTAALSRINESYVDGEIVDATYLKTTEKSIMMESEQQLQTIEKEATLQFSRF